MSGVQNCLCHPSEVRYSRAGISYMWSPNHPLRPGKSHILHVQITPRISGGSWDPLKATGTKMGRCGLGAGSGWAALGRWVGGSAARCRMHLSSAPVSLRSRRILCRGAAAKAMKTGRHVTPHPAHHPVQDR